MNCKLILVGLAALSLTACGDAQSKGGGSGDTPPAAQACCGIDPGVSTRNNSTGPGSGGGGGGGGGVTLSVSSTKTLDSLTDEERDQICADVEAATTRERETVCNLSGVLTAVFGGAESDAELQAACEAGKSECDLDLTEDCSVPSCADSTVGDLTACYNDSLDIWSSLPSCSELTLASAEDFQQEFGSVTAESCAFMDRCEDVNTPEPDPRPDPVNNGSMNSGF